MTVWDFKCNWSHVTFLSGKMTAVRFPFSKGPSGCFGEVGYKGAGIGTETFRGLGDLATDDWLFSAGGGEKWLDL